MARAFLDLHQWLLDFSFIFVVILLIISLSFLLKIILFPSLFALDAAILISF